jgi:hypothetical protein
MTQTKSGIAWTRDGMRLRAMPQYEWPAYLVSAPHALVPEIGADLKRPYGVWHARQVGSLQTACGQSAVTWRYFWTLDFSQAGAAACSECVRVLSTIG